MLQMGTHYKNTHSWMCSEILPDSFLFLWLIKSIWRISLNILVIHRFWRSCNNLERIRRDNFVALKNCSNDVGVWLHLNPSKIISALLFYEIGITSKCKFFVYYFIFTKNYVLMAKQRKLIRMSSFIFEFP